MRNSEHKHIYTLIGWNLTKGCLHEEALSAQAVYRNDHLPHYVYVHSPCPMSNVMTPSWVNDSYTVSCVSNFNLSVLCLPYTVKFRK